jgi:MoxR-like ATPase
MDEIDKAPRDLPNDILNEIERMFFEVKETGESYEAAKLYRPILILTSNQEKDLPDAFRRRCVFFHIRFPEDRLESIVRNRLPDDALPADSALKNAIEHFLSIRKLGLEKNPSTAELLGWIALLSKMDLNVKDAKSLTAEEKDALLSSYSVLAKSDEDLKRLRTELTRA